MAVNRPLGGHEGTAWRGERHTQLRGENLVTLEAIQDYYLILGIPRHTNGEGVRRAYLRKARQYHPDLHPDDPDAVSKMQAVNVAYATLADAARRDRYDTQRVTIHVRHPQTHSDPSGASHAVHHIRARREPGTLGTAMALFMRLFHYVTAALPL